MKSNLMAVKLRHGVSMESSPTVGIRVQLTVVSDTENLGDKKLREINQVKCDKKRQNLKPIKRMLYMKASTVCDYVARNSLNCSNESTDCYSHYNIRLRWLVFIFSCHRNMQQQWGLLLFLLGLMVSLLWRMMLRGSIQN